MHKNTVFTYTYNNKKLYKTILIVMHAKILLLCCHAISVKWTIDYLNNFL